MAKTAGIWVRLVRLGLWLRFHLWQRRRFNRLVLERVAGKPFLVLPGVFNPTLFLTSDFMVTALNEALIPPGSSVLDLGTGSGVGAVFAGQWAGRVTAVDVNRAAVRCARINVLLNSVENQVEVVEGDLFTPVSGKRFDVILFNPPFYRGEPRSELDRAFHATDLAERFAANAGDHLQPGGRLLLVLSTLGDEAGFLDALRHYGFQAEVAKRRQLPGERITLYSLEIPSR